MAADAIDYSAAVAGIFGAVVGVLGSIMAFSPRVRALERDATAADLLRKEQRESDARILQVELNHIREDAARQFADMAKKIDGHHENARNDCKQNERREIAILQLLSQVAGKLKVNNRLTDSLQNIMAATEDNENG